MDFHSHTITAFTTVIQDFSNSSVQMKLGSLACFLGPTTSLPQLQSLSLAELEACAPRRAPAAFASVGYLPWFSFHHSMGWMCLGMVGSLR